MGWVINVTPRPLYPRERLRYPLYRRLGGLRGRYGRVRKISHPTEIRSPDHPARKESLYRLSYPGPLWPRGKYIIIILSPLMRNILTEFQAINLSDTTECVEAALENLWGDQVIRMGCPQGRGKGPGWLSWLQLVVLRLYRSVPTSDEPSPFLDL